ncbi:Rhodanese-related sulfurtransferase [Thiothrix caldifontis]|jgi:Rhodanese-related sulfurtransferase|uniref:Rhodanese-related sulfurtransferase n=1 Tax=Thiothrix caldifontis TaxID=525918 RepID=A0A1H4GVC3_9GAMM|nr:rhodanese-like domain-containing protein [Thiothrix caldifontis]SEB13629.1 Rhodanese-related sulfurtransferase [Thiothrix caldifontis]
MKRLFPLVLLVSLVGFTGCADKSAGINTTATAATTQGGYTNVSNTELKDLLAKKVTLIDIRLPEEWQETGIVAGSKPLTLFEANGQVSKQFAQTIQQIAPPDQPVALICRTGNRTQAGAEMLAAAGYKQVYNVTKGIKGWIGDGNPVTPLK